MLKQQHCPKHLPASPLAYAAERFIKLVPGKFRAAFTEPID
ncbi:MAG: hypothetical protein ACI88G_001056, partial [Woeseiaceae bacterium]